MSGNQKIPNVLIVDDNPSDLIITSGVLKKAGFTVFTSKDGFAALEEVNERIPDLIIMDLNMPKMSGLDLLKKLRANPALKAVPIMIMSSRNQAKDVTLAIRLGAQDYLVKPVDLMIMQSKVEKIKNTNEKEWYQYPVAKEVEVVSLMRTYNRLLTINEIGFTTSGNVQFKLQDPVQFDFDVIPELGIGTVQARVNSCEAADGNYIMSFSFIGLRESDCKQIRLYCTQLKAAEAA